MELLSPPLIVKVDKKLQLRRFPELSKIRLMRSEFFAKLSSWKIFHTKMYITNLKKVFLPCSLLNNQFISFLISGYSNFGYYSTFTNNGRFRRCVYCAGKMFFLFDSFIPIFFFFFLIYCFGHNFYFRIWWRQICTELFIVSRLLLLTTSNILFTKFWEVWSIFIPQMFSTAILRYSNLILIYYY